MSKGADDAVNAVLDAFGLKDVRVSGVLDGKGGRVAKVQLTMKRTVDHALLERAMQSNDAATAVMLWTLEIEHQLALLLEEITGSRNNARDLNSLILMLKTVRFENDIYGVVDGFRRLRNKFAHEKDASLEKHLDIVDAIFRCRPPSPTEDEIHTVSDGETSAKISDLPTIIRLQVYANLAIYFLATAGQIYSFPKPSKRIAVSSKKLPDPSP